jgi:hypothetical protein
MPLEEAVDVNDIVKALSGFSGGRVTECTNGYSSLRYVTGTNSPKIQVIL